MEKLLTARDVAEGLGLPEESVRRMAREGILPTVRTGRRVWFAPTALKEFIRTGGRALAGGWRKEAP